MTIFSVNPLLIFVLLFPSSLVSAQSSVIPSNPLPPNAIPFRKPPPNLPFLQQQSAHIQHVDNMINILQAERQCLSIATTPKDLQRCQREMLLNVQKMPKPSF